jgi:hypothetical protein
MIIKSMNGLGDCLFLRPIIRRLPMNNLILCTPWPNVFQDLGPIKFMKTVQTLRTQSDNQEKYPKDFWVPFSEPDWRLNYRIAHENITEAFCRQLLNHQPKWLNNEFNIKCDLPNPFNTTKPICLIRPTTLRSEWLVTSRGPKPEYLQRFVDQYRDKYYIVSVASLMPKVEWYEKRLEGCDLYIQNANCFEKTYRMFLAADLIVCGASFWVPLALAMNKKTICIHGGMHPPHRIIDPRIMRSNFYNLAPDPYCCCYQKQHNCNKDIPLELIDSVFKEAAND